MQSIRVYLLFILVASEACFYTKCGNPKAPTGEFVNTKTADSLKLILEKRQADSIAAIISSEAAYRDYLNALKDEQAVHDRAIKPTAYGMDTVKYNPKDEAVFVIGRSGADGWGFRDGHHFKFKDRLSVRYKNDTLLGVEFDEHRGQPYPTLYIWRYTAGNELKIPMDNFDVNQAGWSGEDEANNNYASQNDVSGVFNSQDYPDIEVNIISEKKFLDMQKSTINWFTPDTVFKKQNGLLKLKLVKGEKVYRDEGENSYSYMGQIKFINAYAVHWSCGECEEAYFLLIDKTTGKQKYLQWGFADLPQFSPDKKYILTLKTSLKDKAELVIHKYINDSAYTYSLKEFEAWRPISKGFWGVDNCYYTPAYHPDYGAPWTRKNELKRNTISGT